MPPQLRPRTVVSDRGYRRAVERKKCVLCPVDDDPRIVQVQMVDGDPDVSRFLSNPQEDNGSAHIFSWNMGEWGNPAYKLYGIAQTSENHWPVNDYLSDEMFQVCDKLRPWLGPVLAVYERRADISASKLEDRLSELVTDLFNNYEDLPRDNTVIFDRFSDDDHDSGEEDGDYV